MIALILIKMLRIDYYERQLVSDYLKKKYCRELYRVQTVETGYTTLTEKTTDRYGFNRIKVVIAQSHQNDPFYSDVLSRNYDVVDISETIEIASSKRRFREAIYLYNNISPRSFNRHPRTLIQIENA